MPVESDLRRTEAMPPRRGPQSADLRWWREPDERLASCVWGVARKMEDQLSARRMRDYIYHCSYNNMDVQSVYDSGGTTTLGPGAEFGRIELNVIQNAIDTAASMIAKSRPQPLFVTDGGDYDDFLRAEQLTRYVAGVFDDAEVHARADEAFTHAGVCGTGALQFREGEDRITCEHVPMVDLIYDELDAHRRQPSQLHRRRVVLRDQLIEQYPEHAEELGRLGAADTAPKLRTVVDALIVLESWHLPSAPGADDGVYCVSVNGLLLEREAYEEDHYPIVFWRWYEKSDGFCGRGLAEEIGPIQRTINKTLRQIDAAQDLCSAPVWLAPRSGQIAWDSLVSNDIGRVVEFAGPNPPALAAPSATAPDIYQHLWQLVGKAYEMAGVSQGMAGGTKPPELQSGAAIREASDLAHGRFMIVSLRWEQLYMLIAELIVELSRKLYKRRPKLAIQTAEEGEWIKWSDVDLDRDRFKISCYPVSSLPASPAGRLAMIEQWIQGNWIPREQGIKLLRIPDLRRYANLETATPDLVQQQIGEIKRTGKYSAAVAPIVQMNLAQAMSLATRERVRATWQKLPQETLDSIDLYLAALDDLIKQQTPPAPAPPPMMGPPPGAPPMPPPPPGA